MTTEQQTKFDSLVKNWKRGLKTSNISQMLKDGKQYTKPSVKKRSQKDAAKFRQKLKSDRLKVELKKSTCWSDDYIILLKPD